MKYLSHYHYLIIALMFFFNISNGQQKFQNIEFNTILNSYIQYIDSIKPKHGKDFIEISARLKEDTIIFDITLSGGSYSFIKEANNIIDYFDFNGTKILLMGDFPNEIVNLKKNEHLNILEDIVKKKYYTDYLKFKKNPHLVLPLIYDYKELIISFIKNKLIDCKELGE